MAIDSAHYYRLTTRISGKDLALDVSPDQSVRPVLRAPADVSGQYWRFVPAGAGHQALRNAYLGEAFSLEMNQPAAIRLAPTNPSPKQVWMVQQSSATCALINQEGGSHCCLRVKGGGLTVSRSTAAKPRHLRWSATSLATVPQPVAIPPLQQAGDVYCPEGPTDFNFYARPEGTVSAVMIFVDFPDAEAGSLSASDCAAHLLGEGRAQGLFEEQSYGHCRLAVDVRSDLGWKRVTQPSTAYDCHNFLSHRQYVADAAARFAGEIEFSQYQFVLIVAPPSAAFLDSPAFNARPGEGVPLPNGEIRLGVTFGRDSYRNSYINLVHEVSHLMGLPDLYPYGGGVDSSRAGCWDIMSDIFHCEAFIGWHRHKNGWLRAERSHYLPEAPQERYLTLSPLSTGFGTSMIVVPIDDAQQPGKIFVVELAQPRAGTAAGPRRDGVLVYTVNASIPTGHSPVAVQARLVSNSQEHGYLCEAAYRPGDSATFTEDHTSLTLAVLQQFGDCFHVKLAITRA
ncbi:MAG: hypothetical protein U0231_06970 [Nitrospiraceae bacterium]